MNLHINTPVLEMITLNKKLEKEIFLKMECYQPSGSFKIRGIGLLCQESVKMGAKHLISSSGGNAGYSVAYAGRMLGVKVTVVVPTTTPQFVCERLEMENAIVHVHGSVWDEAHEYALSLTKEKDTAYIPPFDNPIMWKGHATLIDEAAKQCPKPDAVILSVGGGGLLCGVVEGLMRNGWQDVPVIAVETEGAASLYRSVEAGKLIKLDSINTIATSLGAMQVAPKAFEYAMNNKVIPHLVTDKAAANACLKFAEEYRTLIEPACGASLSVVYDNASVIHNAKTILVIVCGGIGVNITKIAQWQGMLNA